MKNVYAVSASLQLIENGGLAGIVKSNDDDFVLWEGNTREKESKEGAQRNTVSATRKRRQGKSGKNLFL